MNSRRKLVIWLGVGALAAPTIVFAQQISKMSRIGFLAPRRPGVLATDVYGGFVRGMRELGYVEGKNLHIEWRSADGMLDRMPGLAAELVKAQVDVIVTAGTPAAIAAQKSTTSIPIVMGSTGDPVGAGLVNSLGRPGGNITGLSTIVTELGAKRLELLLAMVPKVTRVGVLVVPDDQSSMVMLKRIQSAVKDSAVKILAVEARTLQAIDAAFDSMSRQKIEAVILAPGGLFNQNEIHIAKLAAKMRLPAISYRREFSEAGGLMSYGDNRSETFRRAAVFVDKILKGAKPSDLPVEQPTTFELIINGRTAGALGLKIPQSLLISADRIIE